MAIDQQVYLRAATAHIDVHVVAVAVFLAFQVVVIDDLGFFLSVDDFDFDTCLFLDHLDDVHSVHGIAHGRSGAGTVMLHAVDFHQLAVSLHQPAHPVGLFRGDFAFAEYIETQSERHTQEQHLRQFVYPVLIAGGNTLDKQADGVRTDVDSRVILYSHNFYSLFK